MPVHQTRMVRNYGPFPYIQSEGCWRALPDTSTVHVPPPQPEGPCPPPPDTDQVQALLRHQEHMRHLQQHHGCARDQDEEQGEADKDWFPVGQHLVDPLSSPRWADCLSPWERLNTHHTLNSVRRHAQLQRSLEPRDQLDLALSAAYQHDRSLWPGRQDICIQPETLGWPTWRVLRNLRVLPQDAPERRDHPLHQSGVPSRVSVHSVKLAISGNHMAQTNAGFSRKVDGTFYS